MLYLLISATEVNRESHFQPFFPQNLSIPAFSIHSQSLEYEPVTDDLTEPIKLLEIE